VKTKVAALTKPQAELLRKLTPPGAEKPAFLYRHPASGRWMLKPASNGPATVYGPTAQGLLRAGYITPADQEGDEGGLDVPPAYFLTAKGAALVAAALKAEDKPNRDDARAKADELLRANSLDGRADFSGVYPVPEKPGVYEVEYDESPGSGRLVVTVDRHKGTADLQRQ
jgi:hypothetical protein